MLELRLSTTEEKELLLLMVRQTMGITLVGWGMMGRELKGLEG
jgi:hypothetical protein